MKFVKWSLVKINEAEWVNPINEIKNNQIDIVMKFAIGFDEAGLTECYGFMSEGDILNSPVEYGLIEISKDDFLSAAKTLDSEANFDELGYFYINQFGHNPNDPAL